MLKAPGAPAAVLPHLPFVLPALFAGSALGLFLFGKVSDQGFRRAISALLFFSGIALVDEGHAHRLRPSRSPRCSFCRSRRAVPRHSTSLTRRSRAWLPGCRAFLEQHRGHGLRSVPASAPARSMRCSISARCCEPIIASACRCARHGSEIIATILEDIEAMRPEVDRQDFKGMVLSILRFHWPCRE